MTDPVRSVPPRNQGGPFSAAISEGSGSPTPGLDDSQFGSLKMVVDTATGYQLSQPEKLDRPKMNQQARERVFLQIVSSTLNNKNHPYYSLVSPKMRQEMIDAIAEQLTPSHYFQQETRRA